MTTSAVKLSSIVTIYSCSSVNPMLWTPFLLARRYGVQEGLVMYLAISDRTVWISSPIADEECHENYGRVFSNFQTSCLLNSFHPKSRLKDNVAPTRVPCSNRCTWWPTLCTTRHPPARTNTDNLEKKAPIKSQSCSQDFSAVA
jgi:hypothetical protein